MLGSLIEMILGYWVANAALLYPSFRVQHPNFLLLLLAALVTAVDGFVVWIAWLNRDETFALVVIVPFIAGCFGVVRLARLSKRV